MRRFSLTVLVLATVWNASAYDFIGKNPIRWPQGDVEIILQLDATRAPEFLSDGHNSWDAVANEALELWNSVLPTIRFTSLDGFGNGDGNERNEVFFSQAIYGHRFPRDVLAVTTTWFIGDERVEGDTVFNASIPWNSYRGDFDGHSVDFRRVAIHEFGHLVGLDHPDEAKQVVPAIMNSIVSDLDAITEDDALGASALYAPLESRYTINVSVDPPQSGTVSVSPSAPDGKFAWGALVTLAPKQARGFRFNLWDAPNAGSKRALRFRVYEDQNITAVFSSNTAPRIVTQPKSQFASIDDVVVLRVKAANAARASYQWQFEGEDIAGATQPILTLPEIDHADSGLYSVIVRTAKGQATSKPARLIVDGY
ncbi:MAG TPA: matrixin family metalloprotease [Candidatus Acidoferrum sp.]|nr:matrixin family metalloprotease [Candidatus Acidoferrum sp.]